jgi:hypothetical protein
MSTVKLTDVWEHSQHTGTHLLCMVAMADQATKQGYSWPSVKSIGDMCRVSKRQAIRLAAKCVESGELYRHERPGKSNQWVVMVGTSLDDFLEVAEANLHIGEHEAKQIYAVCQSKMQAFMTPDIYDRGDPDTDDRGDVHDRGGIHDRGLREGGDIHDRGDADDRGDIAVSVTPDIATSPDPLITINNNGNDRKPFSFFEKQGAVFPKEAQLQMSKPTHQSYLATAECERIDETAEFAPVGSAEFAPVEPTSENGCKNCTGAEIAPVQELCTTPVQTVAPDPSITINDNGRNQEPFVFSKEHWRTFLEVAQSAMSKPMYQSALATAEFDVVDESGEMPIVAIWAKDQYAADWLNGQGSLSLLLGHLGGRPAQLYARPKN